MAGLAKPNIEGLGSEAPIILTSTSYHNGVNDDTIESLLDGNLNTHTKYGVLVTTNTQSHFKFKIDKKVRIHAYGTSYSDSGGSAGKKVKLYNTDENTLVGEFQTKQHEWYVLFPELEAGSYQLKVESSSNNYIQFTEWYVEDLECDNIVIKDGGKYYSFKKEKYNTVTKKFDEISVSDIQDNLCDSGSLTKEMTVGDETFIPLHKFENPKIITVEPPKQSMIHALKSKKELVVASGDFSTGIMENIDYLKAVSTVDSGCSVKVVISNDKGNTWYSTGDNGETWEELNNNLTTSQRASLEGFNEQDLNEFKNEINEKGFDIGDMERINFNNIKTETLRLAYVLNVNSCADECSVKSLNVQFDSKGNMKLTNDVEVRVNDYSVIVTPKINTNLMKINIINSPVE